MGIGEGARRLLAVRHGRLGLALLVVGEVLIVARLRPLSDFYFPLVWLGLTLFLDAAVLAQSGRSLFSTRRRLFLALLPLSAAFWWLFEWLNLAVQNWQYIGGEQYNRFLFVFLASLDFSTVLPAVWMAAACVNILLPRLLETEEQPVPGAVLGATVFLGVVCLTLPILAPRYFFGLIWGSAALILDPINAILGRPSMLRALWNRHYRLPLSFALGALGCGFLWETWNFWSMPKWIYSVPYVGYWHVFEMPLLGYAGYLPFGLELFAMTNFVLPLLGLGTLTLEKQHELAAEGEEAQRAS